MVHMVHIFWKRKGWLIALTIFICSLLSEIITRAITNDDTFYQTNPYPLSIALLVSGLLTFYIDKRLANFEPGQQTKPGHSLFFIPISYWGWILIVISILVFVIRKFGTN